jgi:pimeloyl-ACP methyl ester carboxylesterase
MKLILRLSVGLVVSMLTFLGVFTGLQYRRDIQAFRQKLDGLGSQIIDTKCGTVEFARYGSGYPVLSIHGNGGGFDQGLSLAQTYLGEGFQIIAPSRFGYLGSPLPAGATPVEQADAYACLLDALEIKQAAIFTTSAGVTSSIQFALRYPERLSAMVLHSPNAPGKVDVQLPPQPVFRTMLRSDFMYWLVGTNMLSMFVPKELPLTDEMTADIRQAALSVLPSSRRANGMVFDTYLGNHEINNYPLDQVRTPTLVISAIDDPAALHENACTLAERIPNARLVAISDGGHLMLGHTEEVKYEITQFLLSDLTLAKYSQ